MKQELIIPSIQGFFVKIGCTPPDHASENLCDWHVHNELELFLLTAGQRTFFINHEELTLDVGDIIFINRRIPHKVFSPNGSQGILLQFQAGIDSMNNIYKNAWELMGRKDCEYAYLNYGSKANQQFTHCISHIWNEYFEKSPAYDAFIKAYMFELFALLYRHEILSNPEECLDLKRLEKIAPALEFINQHYASHISLEELSHHLLVDKSYICRLFKKILGTTFIEYLNYVRVNHAQTLLLSTQKNISEIAYETGFSSEAYFIKCFKKYYFCTPLVYRKITSVENLMLS